MSVVYLKGMEVMTSDTGAAWNDAGADFRAFLAASTHVELITDEWLSDVIANEISQAPTHAILASSTVTVDILNSRVVLDSADLTFASVAVPGDIPAYVVIYLNTGNPATSPLICSLQLTTPPAPDGGSYTIVIGSGGAIQLSN